MPELDDREKPASAEALEVAGPDAEGVVMVRARGALDATAFDTALARAAHLKAETVVIDLLEVEAFPMEAAGALLRQRQVSTATATTRRLLLRPSPAVARKLEQLGLTAVLLDTHPSEE